MKILYVSTMPLEYSSSANMRNLALLKGLQENGNELYLLTQEPQKDLQHYDENLRDVNFKKEYFLKLNNIHAKVTMKKNSKNTIKNIIYKILIKFRIYDFKSSLTNQVPELKIDEKFDIIISSSDPKSSHLLAEKLIKSNPEITKRWIQYWGDPFANDINKKSLLPAKIIQKEERRITALADKVVYVSPFTYKKQTELYGQNKDKMCFLPIPYHHPIVYNKCSNNKLNIGYFGDYYSKDRNIKPLYKAIEKSSDIVLNICGNSDLKLSNKDDNIYIYPRQSLKVIRKFEEKMDILICVCNKRGTQIPGKIYHYSATNKPILIIVDGENKENLREYFNSFNRYYICENREEEIIKKIKEIQEDTKENKPLDLLSSKNIARRFIEEI